MDNNPRFRRAPWLHALGRPGRWVRALLCFIVFIVMGSIPARAAAEVILAVADAQVVEGEAGYLDVYFRVPSGTPSLAFYMVELTLTDDQGQSPTGIRFVYDDPATQEFARADSPVFLGSKAVQTAARPSLPGSIAAANDFLAAGEVSIEDGAGLLRLAFETDPGSCGSYSVTIDSDALRTNLYDGSAAIVPIDAFDHGTLTVTPVPEPAALLLLLAVPPAILVVYRNRRGR